MRQLSLGPVDVLCCIIAGARIGGDAPSKAFRPAYPSGSSQVRDDLRGRQEKYDLDSPLPHAGLGCVVLFVL